ncbi:MAG: transglutaminase domain-containing protein [bacterium]|nr:transglutaminase domain-containing protein [bacterium]
MNYPVPDSEPLSRHSRERSTERRFEWLAGLAAAVIATGLLFATTVFAGGDMEASMQADLGEVRNLASRGIGKIEAGESAEAEVSEIRARLEGLKASHLLMKDRFAKRGEKAKGQGAKASMRQGEAEERYVKGLDSILDLMEKVSAKGWGQKRKLRNLKEAIDKSVRKRKLPIHGTLPYRHLNLPARKPVSEPFLIPAYRGGDAGAVADADLKSSDEAPISKEIAQLAESLHWNPVEIYEYVKNNMETEWYYGCMKGAEETLRQKSGNDCDQATLLVSLLRASSFPARYVTGVMEFFGGLEQAKNLTGIADPMKIAAFFQKAGIPYEPIIEGGKISSFRLQHVWVEALIPYANYRGAVIDGHGKTWLALDTSIKARGYQYNSPEDIFSGQWPVVSDQLNGLRDNYLTTPIPPYQGGDQGEVVLTPLEHLEGLFTANSLQTTDFMRTKTLKPEVLNIIPAGLQFYTAAVTGEYAALPEGLKQKARFIASSTQNAELLNYELPLYKLSGRRVAISYEPETVEDQEIINAWGGLDNVPAYLIHLRPVITIDGERVAVGINGIAMGSDFDMTVELYGAGSTTPRKITNTHIAGNLSVIGIASNIPSPLAISSPLPQGEGAKNAEQLLYEEAMSYISRWSDAEDELASLLHAAIARPLPTVVTLGGVIDVTYLLDTPHNFEWKGVFMDADFRTIEIIPSTLGGEGEGDRKKLFMQLASLQGSVLENRIFEDDFKVDSISTAKLMQIAKSNSIPMLEIDSSNADSILPTLPFDEYMKEDISNSVNQGLTVTIPQSEVSYQDWNGIGWIKENPATGESGWMLTGMIAGGMTSLNKNFWIMEDLIGILSQPNFSGVNTDPGSVARLVRLNRVMSDYQKGKVDEKLANSLVVMALDESGKAVMDVPVTFKAFEGGGLVQGVERFGSPLGAESETITVTTGSDGIARATLKLGKYTEELQIQVPSAPPEAL